MAPAASMLVFFAGSLSAGTIFQATGSSVNGDLDATVTFGVCVAGCALDITLQNNIADPVSAGQLLSNLAFNLSNDLTSLTSPGTLSDTISNGSGGAVTVVDFQNGNSTTTTKPAQWQFGYTSGSFFLNDLTGGQPVDMIIGSGPYNNANTGITMSHNPSLGTTMFEISGITGLSTSTMISNVVVSFGGGPDGFSSVVSCTGNNCGSTQNPTPEPATLALTGLGLLGLGAIGRRLRQPR
jgi:hypothetical protein